MRPITYTLGSYAAADTAAIAALQSGTGGTRLTMVGVAGGVAAPFVNDVARTVSITSAADESGNRFVIHGTGTKGNSLLEAIAGANAGIVETQNVFSNIYSITPEFDTAGNVSAGIVADVPSPWLPVDYAADDAPISVALYVPATPSPNGVNASVQVTMDQLGYNSADPQAGGHHGSVYGIYPPTLTPLAPVTAVTLTGAGNDIGSIDAPVTAVRVLNTGRMIAGSVVLKVLQGVRAI